MKQSVLNKPGLCILVATVLFIGWGAVSAVEAASAQDAKNVLFIDADQALKTAEEKQAWRYSPKTFEKGLKQYKKAKSENNLDYVRKKLDKATSFFKKAAEIAESSTTTFKEVIKAREDALSAEASRYSEKNWKRAEDKFQSAIKGFESGSEKSAKAKGKDAGELYRAAELKAIKVNYLEGAWALLKSAKKTNVKKYAPKTIEKARNLIEKAEKMLERERYKTSDAGKLAKEAKYEATHATQLYNTIDKLEDEDKTFEDVMLANEALLAKVANSTGKSASFEQGPDKPVKNIIASIKKLQAENKQLTQTVKKKNSDINALAKSRSEKEKTIKDKVAEIDTLKEKIDSLELRVSKLKSLEKAQEATIEATRIRKEKVARIEATFSNSEAEVSQNASGNVIIRLYGLTFPKGKAEIQPQYFGLLKKVHNSIAEFPNSRVKVEGHTDSTGSDSENMKLSSERAVAVKEYIVANTDTPREKVEAEGFGEVRPVASNETKGGRAKNRRIDVIIKPTI